MLAIEGDHTPTMACAAMKQDKSRTWVSRKRQLYDRTWYCEERLVPLKRELDSNFRVASTLPDLNMTLDSYSGVIAESISTHFPKPPHVFKKNIHISDYTRALASRKHFLREQIRVCKSLAHIHEQHEVLQAYAFALRATAKAVRQSAWRDRLAWYYSIVAEVESSDARSECKAAYVAMKKLEKSVTPTRSTIVDASNSKVFTPVGVRVAFQGRLADIARGSAVSASQLFDIYESRSTRFSNVDAPAVLVLLPSLQQLVGYRVGAKMGSAAAEDCLPPDFVHLCPQEFAMAMHPLVHQVMTSFREPLAWLGGIAHELYKGKGPLSSVLAYRFAMLSDALAKCYHKHLRTLALPHLESCISKPCVEGS